MDIFRPISQGYWQFLNYSAMISRKILLNIIRTEAIEYGGVQEIPSQTHGAKLSYHSAKRAGRGPEPLGNCGDSKVPSVLYDLRLVRQSDGSLQWKD